MKIYKSDIVLVRNGLPPLPKEQEWLDGQIGVIMEFRIGSDTETAWVIVDGDGYDLDIRYLREISRFQLDLAYINGKISLSGFNVEWWEGGLRRHCFVNAPPLSIREAYDAKDWLAGLIRNLPISIKEE